MSIHFFYKYVYILRPQNRNFLHITQGFVFDDDHKLVLEILQATVKLKKYEYVELY